MFALEYFHGLRLRYMLSFDGFSFLHKHAAKQVSVLRYKFKAFSLLSNCDKVISFYLAFSYVKMNKFSETYIRWYNASENYRSTGTSWVRVGTVHFFCSNQVRQGGLCLPYIVNHGSFRLI